MSKYTINEMQGMAMHVIASEAMGDQKARAFYQALADRLFFGTIESARDFTRSLAGV